MFRISSTFVLQQKNFVSLLFVLSQILTNLTRSDRLRDSLVDAHAIMTDLTRAFTCQIAV